MWSRATRFRAQVEKLRTQIDLERAAHQRTVDQLNAEIAHSGRLHRDLIELQDAVDSGQHVKQLTDRLHQFTEASVDADLAVHDALTDHARHHDCTRRDEEPRPTTAETTKTEVA